VEIDPKTITPPPIKHRVLEDALLEEIARIHSALQDVLAAPGSTSMSLEQFELQQFMRADRLDQAITLWRAVALGLRKVQACYPKQRLDRRFLYRWLILMICGALTDEEMREEKAVTLAKCFRSAWIEVGGALEQLVHSYSAIC
jgi:hypothetical protein